MTKTITSIATAALLATAVQAGGDIAPIEAKTIEIQEPVQKDFYVGVGITGQTLYLKNEKDFFDDTVDSEVAGGAEIKVGYVFYRTGKVSVAVEAQAGRTFWGFDNDDFYSYDYAAFVKPMYTFNGLGLGVYGLLGYAKSGISDSDVSVQENGLAYGVGAEYSITDSVSVYADYTMLPEFDAFEDIRSDKVALGINYRW